MANVRWLLGGVAAVLGLSACTCRARCGPCGTAAPVCGPTAVAVAPSPAAVPAPTGARKILLEATILRVPSDQAERLLGPYYGTTGRSMGILSAADAATLLDRVARDPATKLLHMPSIVTLSGDEASVTVGESYMEALHRPQVSDGYTASLEDAYWSGQELRALPTVLADDRRLSLDLSFISREAPPKGTTPDPASLLAQQIHGRMGIPTMSSGDSVLILVAGGSPEKIGDRVLLFAKPTILPAASAQTP